MARNVLMNEIDSLLLELSRRGRIELMKFIKSEVPKAFENCKEKGTGTEFAFKYFTDNDLNMIISKIKKMNEKYNILF